MLTVRSDVTGLQVCPGRVDALGRITHGVDRRYRSDGRLGLQWWHRRGAPVRHVRSLNARTRRKRYASDGACRCGVRGASGAHTARPKANLPQCTVVVGLGMPGRSESTVGASGRSMWNANGGVHRSDPPTRPPSPHPPNAAAISSPSPFGGGGEGAYRTAYKHAEQPPRTRGWAVSRCRHSRPARSARSPGPHHIPRRGLRGTMDYRPHGKASASHPSRLNDDADG